MADSLFEKEEPVVHLERVKVVTGEENEIVVYKERVKLFRYAADSKEWKERGMGELKLLQHKDKKKIRALMRQEKTFKVVMNHVVNPDPKVVVAQNVGSDKTRVLSCLDFAEGKNELSTFCLKFQKPEEAKRFEEMYVKAKDVNGKANGERIMLPEWVDPLRKEADAASKELALWLDILSARKFKLLSDDDLKAVWDKHAIDGSSDIACSELVGLCSSLIDDILGRFEEKDAKLNETVAKQAAEPLADLVKSTLQAEATNINFDAFKQAKGVCGVLE
eukprot:157977_1